MPSKLGFFRTLQVSTALCILAGAAAAYSNAPTFLSYSGLAASDASADVNIGLHKAVLSAAISYVGPGSDNGNGTEHPENAFDGNDSTSTGKAGNITVDLGATFVVERVVVKFASTPTQYEIAWSPYLGPTNLPPTYDLAKGIGSVPASETAHQYYRDLAWINDAKPVDDRKVPAQPARFLNFHFLPVYNGTWQSGVVNEIEIYGHPYVPSAGDEAFLSRKKWLATAYADAAPEGEGQTVTHAIDGQFTNVWLPRTVTAPGQWYQIDLGEEVSFSRIFVVFAIGGGQGTANALNLFASNDTANWGAPIAQLDYGESTTKAFPLEKKRYIRLEQATANEGWWQIDELNLLGPVSADAVDPGTGGAPVGGASMGQAGAGAGGGNGVGGTGGTSGGTVPGNGLPAAGGSEASAAGAGVSPGPAAASDTGGCALTPTRRGVNPSLPFFALLVLAGGLRRARARYNRTCGEC